MLKKIDKCGKWWEAVIKLLRDNPRTLTMLVYSICFALSFGFVLVAMGVAFNLARSASILDFLK